MANPIRAFIAIKIQPDAKLLQLIGLLQKTFSKEKIKWVGPENLHLTLKFLGNISEEQLMLICREIEQLAQSKKSFRFILRGLGYFKNNRQPNVLYANVTEADMLQLMFNELETRLTDCGFEPEHLLFKPHLTLARIKQLKNRNLFYLEIEKYKSVYFQEIVVKELILYESVLKPYGPQYNPLSIVKLKE